MKKATSMWIFISSRRCFTIIIIRDWAQNKKNFKFCGNMKGKKIMVNHDNYGCKIEEQDH